MNIKLLGVSAIWNNINGTAIKYDDGTMICYICDKMVDGLNWPIGDGIKTLLLKDVWTFPDRFISPPSVFAEVNEGNCTTYRAIRNETRVVEQALLCVTKNTSTYAKLSYFAIGRWK